MENIEGVSERTKVRIRWYGDMGEKVTNPVLEFKRKYGLLGVKDKYAINGFNLTEVNDAKFLHNIIEHKINEDQWHQLFSLRPTLINRYRRQYYVSFDKKFRITLDRNLEYYLPALSQTRKFRDPIGTIMELKYSHENEEVASLITQQFPFRLSKSSKYVRGIMMLYDLEDINI